MNQDQLAEENVLITAIHPLRNIMLSDGGDILELIGNIAEFEGELLTGLKEFIDEGWKEYAGYDAEEDGEKDLADYPEWQQREIISEWGYRNIPGDLLIGAVSTPVPKFHEGSGYSFSWGYAFTGFVKGTSLDEIYTAALAWKEGRYESEKKAA